MSEVCADQTVECESDEKCSANGDDRAFVEGALRYFFPRDFGFRQRLFLLMRGWFMCWLAPCVFGVSWVSCASGNGDDCWDCEVCDGEVLAGSGMIMIPF